MSETEPSSQTLWMSSQEWFMLASNFYAIFILVLWPAVKTVAATQNGHHLGRWSAYWIALPYFLIVGTLVQYGLKYFKAYPVLQALIAFILSLKNGSIVQTFSRMVVVKVYCKYYIPIRKLPHQISKFVHDVIGSPFALLTKLINPAAETPQQPTEKPQ